MSKLKIDFSTLSDSSMSKVVDVFMDVFGKDFSEMTKDTHTFKMSCSDNKKEGLSKKQLKRRLVLLGQLAKGINDNLDGMGYADEDGNVNTCSVADVGGDGDLGANVVNLFLLADPTNDYAEVNFRTDAEVEPKEIKRLVFLAKLGILESNDEDGKYSIQRVDDPMGFKNDYDLKFVPPKLDSDNDALELFRSLTNSRLENL